MGLDRANSMFDISIHALLAESDIRHRTHRQLPYHFYPRSPCGERLRQAYFDKRMRDFYPRSPCGERPDTGEHLEIIKIFLSTLSLRRATSTSL